MEDLLTDQRVDFGTDFDVFEVGAEAVCGALRLPIFSLRFWVRRFPTVALLCGLETSVELERPAENVIQICGGSARCCALVNYIAL